MCEAIDNEYCYFEGYSLIELIERDKKRKLQEQEFERLAAETEDIKGED
jgi:hypothetical protein